MMETMSDGDKRKPVLFVQSAFHKYTLSTYARPDSATSDGDSVVNKSQVLPARSSAWWTSWFSRKSPGHCSNIWWLSVQHPFPPHPFQAILHFLLEAWDLHGYDGISRSGDGPSLFRLITVSRTAIRKQGSFPGPTLQGAQLWPHSKHVLGLPKWCQW